MIISPDDLAGYLRIDCLDDAVQRELEMLSKQAQAVCEDFCRRKFEGEGGEVPEAVKLAAMLLASHYYTYREASDTIAESAVRTAVEHLLWPHRDETKMF